MASLISGYEYDIFISYRQKDNKGDKWVSKFVDALKTELEAAFKDDVSVYFDENPHDRLQETHNVDKSLEGKLKCLIFIPVLSQTYCDPNSYAWQYEFLPFNKFADEDRFGRNVRLKNGNYAGRILPIRIHDLDHEDIKLFEKTTGSVLRAMDFVFKTSSGVNRPLQQNEDRPNDNLNKTFYRDQMNKVAQAIKEIIAGLKNESDSDLNLKARVPFKEVRTEAAEGGHIGRNLLNQKSKKYLIVLLCLFLGVAGIFSIYKIISRGKQGQNLTKLEKSIAVLPFANDSPDKENEYFCNGMMEEILNQLQKIKDLRVKARTSVEKYRNPDKDIKEIGHELGVSLIMEGSVRKIGDDLRITAQLIDTKTGDHLWSETYDGKYTTEIFEFQSNVAKKVAASLNTVITPQEAKKIEKKPTTEMLAYDLCAKGESMTEKWFSTHDSLYLKLALNLFNRALEVDPGYISALGGKGRVYIENEKFDSARICYEKIQEIDPESWLGPSGMGSIYLSMNNTDSALIYVQKALSLAPNDPVTNENMGEILCLYKDEVIEGLPYFQKAYDLGGNSLAWVNNYIAWVYVQIGEHQKALKYMTNALSLGAECNYIMVYDYILSVQGKYDEALYFLDSIGSISDCEQVCDVMRYYIFTSRKEFEKAEKFYNKVYNKALSSGFTVADYDIYLAYLYKETGRKDKAVAVLNNSIKRDENQLKGNNGALGLKVLTLRLAAAYALLGDNKNALYYLSELEKTGVFEWPCTLKSFPGFDNLRNDPEFKAIVKRIEDQRAYTRQKIREMEQQGEIDL
jgi:TolB-like protein